MQNKKILRIILPVLILVILAGLYGYKNGLFGTSRSSDVVLSGGSMPLSSEYDLAGWLSQGKPVLIEFGTED